MQYLKQNTSQTIMFGPFVDKADGITLKTDATTITDIDHATTGIFLSKVGGTAAIRYQTSKVASVADAYGMMCVTLLATDTDTVGTLDVLFAKAATYLPVFKQFMVIPASLWDTLMVAQPTAAILKFFDKTSPTGTVNSLPDAVPDASGGLGLTNGTKFNKTVDLTAAQSIACSDKTGFSLSATGLDLILHGATFMVANATAMWELAVRSITVLPAVATDWLTAAGVKADAVTKIQAGLATPTNITAAAGIALSATQAAYAPAKAGDKMDLIDAPNATGISAIVTAINSLATYGLTALNTLLVTTGIKAATIPAATLAASQHVIVDSGTVTTLTNAPGDSLGVTTLLTRLSAVRAGYLDLLNTYLDSAVSAIKTVVDAIKVVTDKFRFTVTNQVDANALTGGSGLDAAGVRSAVGLASANLDTQLAAIPTDADVNAACDTAISDAGIPAAVWVVSVRTLSSFGSLVVDIVTAVWGAATRTLTAFGFNLGFATPTNVTDARDHIEEAMPVPPTAPQVADAVWDEAISGHAVAGSTGAKLSSASAAGDPWLTPLPGTYEPGEAGYIIGHFNTSGGGSEYWPYVVTDIATGNPIAGVSVWVSTDLAGTIVVASGTTDATGMVNFNLDPGTYYIWRQKSGYSFVNPDLEEISA